MKQVKANTISADLRTEFNQRINLHNLVGQDRACSILRTLIDEHHWMQEAKHQIRPIMLYGKCSATTVTRAFANSLGILEHREIVGSLLGCGIAIEDCINRMDEFASYHISGVDCIGYLWHNSVFRLVKELAIEYPEVLGYRRKHKKHFKGQLVLSGCKSARLSAELEKHCQAVIYLNESFSADDLGSIISQRIDFNRLSIENRDGFLNAIVQVGSGDIELCIKLLEWSWKCCRAVGQEAITLQHLNSAMKLWG